MTHYDGDDTGGRDRGPLTPRPVTNTSDVVTNARDIAAEQAKKPIDEREGQPDWMPRAGQMHPVDKAFYDLTVKERNLERVRCDRLAAELRDARIDVVTTLQSLAPHEVTCRCGEGDVFSWASHDEACPRRQVGAMLAGMAAR